MEDRLLLAVTPFGGEVRLNRLTAGIQMTDTLGHAVAVEPDGSYLVAYQVGGATGGIALRRVVGQAAWGPGTPVAVNARARPRDAAIAVDYSGRALVAWVTTVGGRDRIAARLFKASGGVASPERSLAILPRQAHARPVIAAGPDGTFLVTWAAGGARGPRTIFARRIGARGAVLGAATPVNTFPVGPSADPSIAFAHDGRYAIVWVSAKGDVVAQRFGANGSRVGGEAVVSVTRPGFFARPDLAFDAAGDMLVTWASPIGAMSRLFRPDGSAAGGVARLGGPSQAGDGPRAAATDPGGFLVVWSSATGIVGRQVGSDGSAAGSIVAISTSPGAKHHPSVAAGPRGNAFVAWDGPGAGDRAGVFGRRVLVIADASTVLSVTASLAHDTGLSGSDGITSDPRIIGRVSGPASTLRASIDGGPPLQVPAALLQDGGFTLDPASLARLADGPHVVTLVAVGNSGATSPGTTVGFTLDTSAPAAPGLGLSPTSDTGASATDGVTRIADPTVEVSSEPGVELRVSLDRRIVADLPATATVTAVTLPTLAEGQHKVSVTAIDVAGNVSPTGSPLIITVVTSPPAAPTFDLAPASNPFGDGTVTESTATLIGATSPGATVELIGLGRSTVAGSDGSFLFADVPLQVGENPLTARATDLAGNSSTSSRTVVRVVMDAALTWDRLATDAAAAAGMEATNASRAYALTALAMYDAVNAVTGAPGYEVSVPSPAGASAEAAVAAAAHDVLMYLFPAQGATLDAALARSLAGIGVSKSRDDGAMVGRAVAVAVIARRDGDGWDAYVPYTPGTGPGYWQPTGPMFMPAAAPQWAKLEPFAMSSPSQFRGGGPPALDSPQWAADFNEMKAIGRVDSTTRTADQTQIARFWSDGAGTETPPGHWNRIAYQVATTRPGSLADHVKMLAALNVALGDGAVVAWDMKYAFNSWRPATAIPAGDTDGNDQTVADPGWTPLLITPAFPDYVSGHSTFSGAAATVLTGFFGGDVAFTTDSTGLPGVKRSFASFQQAADEAGISRVYGGIHFASSNRDGLSAGRALGAYVLGLFQPGTDVSPPRVLVDGPTPGAISAADPAFSGSVFDAGSGLASFGYRVDDGDLVPVSPDATGGFSFTAHLPADGAHTVTLVASDAKGNVATVARVVRLDTADPVVSVTSPTEGGPMQAGAHLTGTADGTGSPLVGLSYRFDDGATIPVAFSTADGSFDAALDVATLSTGPHTLAVTARDAAGHVATLTRSIRFDTPAVFAPASVTPMDGQDDVGTTFRPRIVFTRPVDGRTLTPSTFFPTDPSGSRLEANVVVANDGLSAWLFPVRPLPGSSRITAHLDGTNILARGDGQPLDADVDGVPGGENAWSFRTVSLSPVPGTSLAGRVLDPGPDLKPMSFDDIRAGKDGALHTADDVFLHPLAGVKVYILGMEGQAVVTDANGNFRFDAVPVGDVKLAVDGRTATNAPAGIFFPEMVMDLQLRPGVVNTPMDSMGSDQEKAANLGRTEVYLPRLQTSILKPITGTGPVTLTVDASAAPDLSPEQRAGLTATVMPGTAVDAQGKPMDAFQVGISAVPPSLVMDMLPPGLLQHTFDITVQAPGVAVFTTPMALTFPNLFGAAPGTKLNFLSFDHTTGRLEIDGTATVSADGKTATTDPGNGVTHPGWHGLTPDGSRAKPSDCRPTGDSDPTQSSRNATMLAPQPKITGADKDRLLTNPKQTFDLVLENVAPKLNPNAGPCDGINVQANPLRFTIELSDSHTGDVFSGLRAATFNVSPGGSVRFTIQALAFDDSAFSAEARRLYPDLMYGTKVTIRVGQVNADGTVTPLTDQTQVFNLYAYYDRADDKSDGTLDFNDTLVDGKGGTVRTRAVAYLGDVAIRPILEVNDPQGQFTAATNGKQFALNFDPLTLGGAAATLDVFNPNGPNGKRLVSTPTPLMLQGKGVAPRTIYANRDALIDTLDRLSTDTTPKDVLISYAVGAGIGAPKVTFQAFGIPSVPINADASEAEIREAVEGLPGVGTGNVLVASTTTVLSIDANGTLTEYGRRIVLTPFGALARSGLPKIAVLDAAGHAKTGWTVVDEVNVGPGGLTKNEQALLDTPDKRAAFADAVIGSLRDDFVTLGGSARIDPGSAPAGGEPGGVSVSWGFTGQNVFGATTMDGGFDQAISNFLAVGRSLPRARYVYDLAKLYSHEAAKPHDVTVFLNKIFISLKQLPVDAPLSVLVQAASQTAAHEVGHAMGLVHTADLKLKPVANEVQKIELSGGGVGDTFTLLFGGEETSPIGQGGAPKDVTAKQVLDALLELRSIPSDIQVTGPKGGPFLVTFASTLTSASTLAGADVPQILGVGTGTLLVPTSTVTQGRTDYAATSQVKIPSFFGGGKGGDDLMAVFRLSDTKRFLPTISLAGLKFATAAGWGAAEVDQYISVLVQSADNDLNTSPTKYANGDFPDDVSHDAPQRLVTGRRLAILGDQTSFPVSLDFGTVEADGPGNASASRTITLLAYGDAPVMIRSAYIAGSSKSFTLPPVLAGTVLQPGDSLDVTVTYDPGTATTGGEAATLVLDTDSVEYTQPDRIALTGTAQRTTAHLQANILNPNNNLGGVLLGDVPRTQDRTLTNDGAAPLTITSIAVAAGRGQADYEVNVVDHGGTLPVVLAPGESLTYRVRFHPTAEGLRPGAVIVTSDDPLNPSVRIPLVGTGLVPNAGRAANNYVGIVDERTLTGRLAAPTQHLRSDASGMFQVFLPAGALTSVLWFDPKSGLIAKVFQRTEASGVTTTFYDQVYQPADGPDSDGDGLPDDIELAIGTDPNKVDTNGDGLSDFDAIEEGLNPLSGRPAQTGPLAAQALPGTPTALQVVKSPGDSKTYAYTVEPTGLDIVDVTQFDKPFVTGRLALNGALGVDVDSTRKVAAIVAASGGLVLADVSDPQSPKVTLNVPMNATNVVQYDGLVYVAEGSTLHIVDPALKAVTDGIDLGPNPVVNLVRDGALLVALTGDPNSPNTPATLWTIDLSGFTPAVLGSVALPRGAVKAFVADGTAWVLLTTILGGGPTRELPIDSGLATVDVQHPDHPALIAGPSTAAAIAGKSVALNGSGLGLIAGGLPLVSGDQPFRQGDEITLIDVTKPADVGSVLAGLPLSADGELSPDTIALAAGLGYLSDAKVGLIVDNYLAYDTRGVAPTVEVTFPNIDVELNKPGVQVVEGSTVNLRAHITDDVQIREVELLLNGRVVRDNVSYPYDLTADLPTIAQAGSTTAVLQVRATDTGGNVTLSDPIALELVPDTIPPQIVALDPAEGSRKPPAFRTVTVNFSEPIAAATATAANFELIRGDGTTITPLAVALRKGGTQLTLVYPVLDQTSYRFVIHAAIVTDRAANPLGASDIVRDFKVTDGSTQPTIRWTNAAGGFWDDPNNWDLGRVPNAEDDVRIDTPGGATVTLRKLDGNGIPNVVKIHSLVSNDPLAIAGGSFTATDSVRVNAAFTLGNPSTRSVPTFKGTILKGSGGQGLTIVGNAVLDGTTINADVSLPVDPYSWTLTIGGGLTLSGTMTVAGGNHAIAFTGNETVASGTFLFRIPGRLTAAMSADGTVTFDKGVAVRIESGSLSATGTFINRGDVKAVGQGVRVVFLGDDFENLGTVTARDQAVVTIAPTNWTNASTGRISSDDGTVFAGYTDKLGNRSTGVNLGLFTATSSATAVNNGLPALLQLDGNWSGGGSITSQASSISLYGAFPSDAVRNLTRGGGTVSVVGTMDNSGRTFTLDAPKGSWLLSNGGTIKGGTFVLNSPDSTLLPSRGTLDGVTVNGDFAVGSRVGTAYLGQVQLYARDGTTFHGTVTLNAVDSPGNYLFFQGDQTVTVGTFVFAQPPNVGGGGSFSAIQAIQGTVTIGPDVVIRGTAGGGGLSADPAQNGVLINEAHVTVAANGRFGVGYATNRATIDVPAGSEFSLSSSTNAGTINADHASLRLSGPASGGTGHPLVNTGRINAVDSTVTLLGHIFSADLGNYTNAGGTTVIRAYLDNAGQTFAMSADRGKWEMRSGDATISAIVGGTVAIDPATTLYVDEGTLRDVTVKGDFKAGNLYLVGDVTINGTVGAADKVFFTRALPTPTPPAFLHAGTFDFSDHNDHLFTDQGYANNGTATFGPGVVIRGGRTTFAFKSPMLNQGTIIANLAPLDPSEAGLVPIRITTPAVTNEGTMGAEGDTLSITDLIANRGTLLAGVGGTIAIGSDLNQDAVGQLAVTLGGTDPGAFGVFTVARATRLAGTLAVTIAPGFTPGVGDRFRVLSSASVQGAFARISATGLPPGLTLAAEYGPDGVTLVVHAA